MTPRLEEANRLLRLARRDQGTFLLLVNLADSDMAAVGFHAQQAAEKALKAVQVMLGSPLARTHDLVALAADVRAHGVQVAVPLEDLRQLNPYAVEYRYDDEIVVTQNRVQLIHLLDTLMQWAASQITAHPPAQD